MSDYQKVIRGRESLKKLPELMKKLGVRKPMVVGTDDLAAALFRYHPTFLSAPFFSVSRPIPDLEDAKTGAGVFRREECDGLISAGGAPSIETAKAIKAWIRTGKEEEFIHGRLNSGPSLPHIAVPGTAGTGSEATGFAAVYVNGARVNLNHTELQPEGVVLDAALNDSFSLYLRKSCALGILAQGIESYWSRGANEDSKVHAYLAIIGVLDNLKAYMEEDPHAAEEMLDAGFQSGKAARISGLSAARALSYTLSERLNIGLGHASMLLLPALWEMMQDHEEMRETLTELSARMRLGDMRMVPKLLKGILYDLDMEVSPLFGGELPEGPECSADAALLSNHPVSLTKEEIRKAFRLAMAPVCENEKLACTDIWKYYGR